MSVYGRLNSTQFEAMDQHRVHVGSRVTMRVLFTTITIVQRRYCLRIIPLNIHARSQHEHKSSHKDAPSVSSLLTLQHTHPITIPTKVCASTPAIQQNHAELMAKIHLCLQLTSLRTKQMASVPTGSQDSTSLSQRFQFLTRGVSHNPTMQLLHRSRPVYDIAMVEDLRDARGWRGRKETESTVQDATVNGVKDRWNG
jgi:hypothetical protein